MNFRKMIMATAVAAALSGAPAFAGGNGNGPTICIGDCGPTTSEFEQAIDGLEYEIDQVNKEDMRVKRGEVEDGTLTLRVEDMAKSRGRSEIYGKDVEIDVSELDQSQEVSDLDNRVTTVEGDVSSLDSRVTTTEGDVSDLEYEIDQVNKEDMRVKSGEVDGDTLTLRVEDMAPSRGRTEIYGKDVEIDVGHLNQSDEVADLDGRVTINEGDIDNLEGDVTNLDNRVTVNEGDISDLDGRVTTVEGDVTNLQGEVTDVDNRVTNIEGDMVQRVSSTETRISSVSRNVSNNSKRITDNSTRIDDNRVAITNNKDQIKRVESESREGDEILNQEIARVEKESVERDSIQTEEIARVEAKSDAGDAALTEDLSTTRARLAETDQRVQSNAGAIEANGERISANTALIVNLEDDIRSAVAGAYAAAGIPQAQPGRIGVGIGGGHYGGENAIAVGASGTTEDGTHTVKFSFTIDGVENGVSAGYMYNF